MRTKQKTIYKALEYLTNHTIKETATKYGVSEATIQNWKKRFNTNVYTKALDRKTEIVETIATLKKELGTILADEYFKAA